MAERARIAAGIALVFAIFLAVQVGALALAGPFEAAGHQPVEDPQNPANALAYVLAILVATGVMLLAFRFDLDVLIRVLVVGAGAWLSVYLFDLVLPETVAVIGGLDAGALALAGLLGVVLFVHPEWYVIDAAGAIIGAVAAGLFGITFDVLPALGLLAVLAVYDAVSVYRTEHMLTLAAGVMELRVPIVLVIPTSAGYSFLQADLSEMPVESDTSDSEDEDDVDGDADAAGGRSDTAAPDPIERDALFIGLGDAVIPSVLVASAAFFAPPGIVELFGVPVTALGAMLGTLVGLAVLLRMVLAGRPHAGLPLLNGGAIAGYLIAALAAGLTLLEALGLGPYV